ncbi:MAG: penicillin-binding protein 2 [Thermomicrobiales bacterium]|nr:penicillin-binding protein 2 [Thermomicrobiales bacterium]
MINRRKRIQLEPEGINARRPDTSRRTRERRWLNRRMFIVKGAVAGGFVALGGRLAQLQLLDREEYQEQASNYTHRLRLQVAPRGLIFDRSGRTVAANQRTWAVRVTPAQLPDDEVELQRVKETVVNALGLNQVLIVDPDAVPDGSHDMVYARIGRILEEADETEQQSWIDYLAFEAKRNYVVLCESNLSPDMAATFRAAAQDLPGVSVVSYLEYLLQNSWSGSEIPITVAQRVPREIALKLDNSRVLLPGISVDDSAMIRTYPGGTTMSHILGYVGRVDQAEIEDARNRTPGGEALYNADDIIGKNGLEYTQEPLLRGVKGVRTVEVDTNEVEQRTLAVLQEAQAGQNLRLTVDLELQEAMRQAIIDTAEYSNLDREARDIREDRKRREYNSGAGAVVMMDPRNGEVLCMVSYPDYDNELFIQGLSQRKYDQLNDPEAKKPFTNRAVGDHWSPGSTLKLFIAAAALREKAIDTSTTFECRGSMYVPWTWNKAMGDDYHCWHRNGGHGTVDLQYAIEQSCDIYFYNVGVPNDIPEGDTEALHYYDYPNGELADKHYFNGLGISKIHENLSKRFWFGEPTGIELPWEAPGLVPNGEWLFDNYQQYWSLGDTINTSIGQGYFLTTPLQLCVNTAALANNGTIYQPRLIKGTVDADVEMIEETSPKKLREIKINKNYLRIVREGMWGVVNDPVSGSVHHAVDPVTGEQRTKWPLSNPPGEEPIVIAGKTGTAEFGFAEEDGTYLQQHAWFTAYAPYDNPEIVVTVFLEDGGESSSYAIPIADRAFRAWFELKGMRDRGLVLRTDERPISEEYPQPNPEGVKLTPGAIVTAAQD